MCFEDDANAEMTQIDLWKSYQGTFLPYAATHPHLIAGDFIKNVSNTFTGASAQVAGQNKYVIRGIKPRVVPVDYRGRELLRCRWRLEAHDANPELPTIFAHADGKECGQFFPNGPSLLEHILSQHLQVQRKRPTPMEGEKVLSLNASLKLFDFPAGEAPSKHDCAWSSCRHSTAHEVVSNTWVKRALLARHVETHLPDGNASSSTKNKHNVEPDPHKQPLQSRWTWLNTMMDEANDAAGVPLGACLVMRNIARGISKMAPESRAQKEALEKTQVDGIAEDVKHEDGDQQSKEATSGKALLMRRVFGPVKERVFYAMAYNSVLKDYLAMLLKVVAQGGA